jgi:hypothetical protein
MKNLARERHTFNGVEWPKQTSRKQRLFWFLAFVSVPFVVLGAAVVLK